MTLWSRGLVKSRDKLKLLHLHYYNTYGYQTYQIKELPWEASTHKVTRPTGYMVLGNHVTDLNHFISTVFMATKLVKLKTHLEGLPSHIQLVFLDRVTIWKIYTPLLQNLWPQNLVGYWLRRGGLTCKRQQLLVSTFHSNNWILLNQCMKSIA